MILQFCLRALWSGVSSSELYTAVVRPYILYLKSTSKAGFTGHVLPTFTNGSLGLLCF